MHMMTDHIKPESDRPAAYPPLKLEEFFSGTTRARGIFEDRFGRVRNEFIGQTTGICENNSLFLTEEFTYRDGKTDKRQWTFLKTTERDYIASSDAVIGKARGRTDGNSFHWTYDFLLDVGKKTWKVRFDDRMYLMDEKLLLNKARACRWGIHIGTVFLCFERLD